MKRLHHLFMLAVLTFTFISCDNTTGGYPEDPFDANLPTLVYTSSTLPAGKVGQSYSADIGTAELPPEAEPATISYTLVSGSLPAGLTLSGTGLISGTPAAGSAGTRSFSVRARADGCNSKTADFSLSIAAADAEGPFVGGSGTPKTGWYTANPGATSFTINDADELAGLAQLVNNPSTPVNFSGKTVTLAVNIDLAAYSNWTPIGTFAPGVYVYTIHPFIGTFNGNGKTIKGLRIDRNSDYQGLFGIISIGAVVDNVKLTNVDIKGRDYIGGVAGANGNYYDGALMVGGTLLNCSVSGSVSGRRNVGGVTGLNSLTVRGCSSQASVTDIGVDDGSRIGGVAGINYQLIENCSASGTVTCTEECYVIGGITGENNGTIRNCHASGDISGFKDVGGIVGFSTGSVENCYAAGDVYGELYAGGVVAMNHSGTVQGCYATGSVSGEYGAGGVAGDSYGGGDIIRDCVALNSSVTITDNEADVVGRVLGEYEGGTLLNNYAKSTMTLFYNTDTPYVPADTTNADNNKDGKNVSSGSGGYNGQTFWETAGFVFGSNADAPWVMPIGANALPKLYWE